MLAFTGSRESNVVYSCLGTFLSESEPHLLIVKAHALELYSLAQAQQEPADEPEFSIPIEATVQTAHAFKLPNSAFHNIALLTRDVSLVLFTHNAEAGEDDFPFEKIALDQVRAQYVVPHREPMIAAVQNHLVCLLYPNTLTVVTFKDNGVEKNELHFANFVPTRLYSDGERLAGAFDGFCWILEGGRIAGLLDEATADASAALKEIKIGQSDAFHGCAISGERVVVAGADGLKSYDESGEKEFWKYPVSEDLCYYAAPYVVFANGAIFKFVDGKFAEVAVLPVCVKSVGETDGLIIGMTAEKAQPVVFVKESQSVFYPFGFKEIAHSVVGVAHSVRGAEKLIVQGSKTMRSFGLGYPFVVDSVIGLEGETICAAGEYVAVSAPESTVVLSRETLAPVEVEGLWVNEPTLHLCQFGSQLVQICPSGINPIGKAPTKLEKVDHAASNSRYLAIAQQQKAVIYEFAESEPSLFKEVRTFNANDDISALWISDAGYLICATWSKMSLITVNVETGSESSLSVKLVVKCLCEVGGLLFCGSSRGEIAAVTIESDGKLTEITSAKVGRSAVSLSVVEFAGTAGVFVTGSHPSIAVFKDGGFDVYPTSAPRPCLGHLQLGPERSVVLGREISIGRFECASILQVDTACADSPIIHLARADATKCAAFTRNSLILYDALLFEQLMSVDVKRPGTFVTAEFFSIGANTYYACSSGVVAPPDSRVFAGPGVIEIYSVNITSGTSSLVATLNTKALATACRFADGQLFVAAGSSVESYSVTEQADATLALAQTHCVDAQMFATDMAIDFGRVAVFDGLASAIVMAPDLSSPVSRDFLAKRLLTGCFVSDITLLVSDVTENVYHLLIEDTRIRTIGKFNVGSKINSLHRWRPHADAPELFVGTSLTGGVFLFTPLEKARFDKLAGTEQKLAKVLEDQGWLNHARFRSVIGDRYLDPSTGFIDGDLFLDIEELDEQQQSDVIGDARPDVDAIITTVMANTFAKLG